jgi:DNA-binding CsgD family transcriptional regulator
MSELSEQGAHEGILGTAVEAAAAAVFVTDEDGHFVAANRFACQMLGHSRADLKLLRLPELVVGSKLPLPLPPGSQVGIAPLRRRDGTNVTVRYQVRTLNGGTRGFAVWVASPRHMPRSSTLDAGTPGTLSERELEILQLIADGLENDAIAKELFISRETVKSHVRRILQKLGAHSRTYAVAVALRRQLVD